MLGRGPSGGGADSAQALCFKDPTLSNHPHSSRRLSAPPCPRRGMSPLSSNTAPHPHFVVVLGPSCRFLRKSPPPEGWRAATAVAQRRGGPSFTTHNPPPRLAALAPPERKFKPIF